MNEWVPVYRLGPIRRSLVYVHNLYNMLLYVRKKKTRYQRETIVL
jgi:hypothetical protein